MRLRIHHTTGFDYEPKATASFNEARLTPETSSGQIVVHSRIDVQPSPWSYTYRDYWGTTVTAFEVVEPHDSLTVTATATVQTDRSAAADPVLTWDDLADPVLTDRYAEFLDAPETVAPPADLARRCAELRGSGRPADVARQVCRVVRDAVRDADQAPPAGPAAQAWERGTGTSRDLAHLTLGALRSLGIPAQYVSGYVHPGTDAPLGEPVPGALGGWVAWWDDAWIGHDPVSCRDVDDRYVVVATGRDADDVTPLAGVHTGGEGRDSFVEVTLTRVS